MIQHARFSYAQARLHARHGMRPDARTWRHLGGLRELTAYLQGARHTSLRSWVLGLSATSTSHEMEYALRRQYRTYVEEVASWQPAPWRTAVVWVQRLPDLPVLQHLLLGLAPPRWVLDDPDLKAFASATLAVRFQELRASDCRPLAEGWETGLPLTDAWLQHWRSLWPPASQSAWGGLERLAALCISHYGTHTGGSSDTSSERAWVALDQQLTRAFRRNSHQPAAAFINLALVSLDLGRLRGDLLRRLLFEGSMEVMA